MLRWLSITLLVSFAVAQTSTSPSDAASTPADVKVNPTPQLTAPAPNPAPTASPNSKTERERDAAKEREGTDALLDLPALPKDAKLSLIGGKVVSVDRILDRIEIQPFGGKKTALDFDVRTQVYRDGVKVPPKEIRPGDRVYADTLLDKDHHVFAKNIRLVSKLRDTDRGHGQVVSYDPDTGKLVMRDELISQPLTLHISRDTVIRKNDGQGSVADLQPGSLIAVSFTPGGQGIAQEISILAVPGSTFIFEGPVTHLDLATHLLVVANKTDGKSYELDYDPARLPASKDVHEGSDVTINATFNGQRYVAQSVTLLPQPSQSSAQQQ